MLMLTSILPATNAVFFNLGSADSFLGSLRILKLVLFWVSMFHQVNIVWEVPHFRDLKKVEKHWFY